MGLFNFRFSALRFFLIAIAIGATLVIAFAAVKNISQKNASSEPTQKNPAISTSTLKNDPDWLKKYCQEQAVFLPQAPFEYKEAKKHENPGSIPPTYISSLLPENKKFNSWTCSVSYPFDNEKAYASMGVEYKFDIKYSNEFDKRVADAHEGKMNSAWAKISPLSNEESGRPNYSGNSFPLIFIRENKELGTLEYATMDFGIDYFVRITVYEK